MACLNMQHKNETQGGFMGPRVSFSNDFIDSNIIHHSYTQAPVSSDFEFSLPTFSSNSADQVFFKAPTAKPLIMKEKVVVTLRDELLAAHDNDNDDDDIIFCNNNNKNSAGWWKEKFGLRKSQNKSLGGLETIDETKTKPTFYNIPSFTGSNRHK